MMNSETVNGEIVKRDGDARLHCCRLLADHADAKKLDSREGKGRISEFYDAYRILVA